MDITVGKIPVIVRQVCTNAFAGAIPEGPNITGGGAVTVNYEPTILDVGSGFVYASPEEITLYNSTQAGLFQFNEPVFIDEVRGFCGAGATMTITVSDSDGSNAVTVASAVDAVSDRETFLRLPLLKGQLLKVTTTAAGIIDVYTVKADS